MIWRMSIGGRVLRAGDEPRRMQLLRQAGFRTSCGAGHRPNPPQTKTTNRGRGTAAWSLGKGGKTQQGGTEGLGGRRDRVREKEEPEPFCWLEECECGRALSAHFGIQQLSQEVCQAPRSSERSNRIEAARIESARNEAARIEAADRSSGSKQRGSKQHGSKQRHERARIEAAGQPGRRRDGELWAGRVPGAQLPDARPHQGRRGACAAGAA